MFDVANPFLLERTATDAHVDRSGHIGNTIYIDWLVSAALAHSKALGYSVERYHEIGAVFVVRRHEIDYLRQGFANDSLVVATWCGQLKRSTAYRHYQIVRPSDGTTLVRALTKWAFMDLKSGRPTPITQEMKSAFQEGIGAVS